ncbi:MAG: helix-turn-helix transcriptional regulator [Pseudomonadota bacterium]
MTHKRPTFKNFKSKALADSATAKEYESLSTVFDMKRQMIAMRTEAGVTQERMAELLGTAKSNISRLESLNVKNSPRLATVESYAQALGYSVRIEFQPNT